MTVGQAFGAADGSRSIEQFSSDYTTIPQDVGILPISYLPNSKLDKLRIFDSNKIDYINEDNPILALPIKTVTVAQILCANPYKELDSSTAHTWLTMCVKLDGIFDFVGDPLNELSLEKNTQHKPTIGSAHETKDSYEERCEIAKRLLICLNQNRQHLHEAQIFLQAPSDLQRLRALQRFNIIPEQPSHLDLAEHAIPDSATKSSSDCFIQ
jgi:hypothetical protein